jgi:invasion protein IalB
MIDMRFCYGVALVLGMALTSPVIAQEAAQDLQPGQVYVAENFGDWELRCTRPEADAAERCNLYQLLNNADQAPVAEVSLFALPEGGEAVAGVNVIVPLGTLLPEQLTITVDANAPRRYPFSFCNANGCIARVGLTQTDVEMFQAGQAAIIRLVPAAAPNQEVLLTLSLSGFTAGFSAARAAP